MFYKQNNCDFCFLVTVSFPLLHLGLVINILLVLFLPTIHPVRRTILTSSVWGYLENFGFQARVKFMFIYLFIEYAEDEIV